MRHRASASLADPRRRWHHRPPLPFPSLPGSRAVPLGTPPCSHFESHTKEVAQHRAGSRFDAVSHASDGMRICYHQGAIWGGVAGLMVSYFAVNDHMGFVGPMLMATMLGEISFTLAVLAGPDTAAEAQLGLGGCHKGGPTRECARPSSRPRRPARSGPTSTISS